MRTIIEKVRVYEKTSNSLFHNISQSPATHVYDTSQQLLMPPPAPSRRQSVLTFQDSVISQNAYISGHIFKTDTSTLT